MGKAGSNTIIKRGCPLRGTTGYVHHYKAAPGDKSVLGVAVGDAVTASTAVAATCHVDVYFTPAVDWIVFSGQCSGNLTQGEIWTTADIEYQTDANSGKEEVNENANSNDEIYIIGKKGSSAFGTYGEALFIWAKSKFTGKITTLT
jgi:hypothetical protein